MEHYGMAVAKDVQAVVGESRSAQRLTLGIVGGISRSHAGNVILEVGEASMPPGNGWVKVAHVVLTPAEVAGFVSELRRQLALDTP